MRSAYFPWCFSSQCGSNSRAPCRTPPPAWANDSSTNRPVLALPPGKATALAMPTKGTEARPTVLTLSTLPNNATIR
eukprot:8056563-Lingulodinium_polyedra.AAC.1